MPQTASSPFVLYETIAADVCRLERAELIERLTHFDGGMTLDFSPEYLSNISTDQMRHLLVAAIWRCRLKQARSA